MAQIFYSPVDDNLRKELDARASAPKIRDNTSLRFMLEKIGTVEIEAFSQGNYKQPIKNSKLGGNSILTEKFQPNGVNGFLSTTSKRIPPFITSAELAITDNSTGLMQVATINITISDPLRDLNFIEAVYLRPGRPVKLKIAYPESAVITKLQLETTTLPGLEKLKTLYPGFDETDLVEFQDMNRLIFLGLVKAFNITYNPDATITVTLSLLGTTNVYTDLSTIGNTKIENDDPDKEDSNITRIKSFFGTIIEEIQSRFKNTEGYADRANQNTDDIYAFIGQIANTRTNHSYVLTGVPQKGRMEQNYVTLAYLIEMININIQSKITEIDSDTNGSLPSAYMPYANIVFSENDDVCVSNYYDNLVSADPMKMFMPDFTTRTYDKSNADDKRWFGKVDFGELKFQNASKQISYPTAIFINVNEIKRINELMQQSQTYKVSDFLKHISALVYRCTGGAIELKLITSPTDQTQLLFYDAKRTESGDIMAYHVPMFANDPRGTIVRDFSFVGKLPDSVSNMMSVLNQNGNELSESQLAPYVAYMYTTVDTLSELGSYDGMDQQYKDALKKLENQYSSNYKINKNVLKNTKHELSKNWIEPSRIIALENALKKYIQTPTSDLRRSSQLAAPVIPFDVTFTIDGINGFRYGDVLQFDMLPDRYRKNIVYTIVSTTHTIDTTGVWSTKIRCMARINYD